MWGNSLPKNVVPDAVEVSIKSVYFLNIGEKILTQKSSIKYLKCLAKCLALDVKITGEKYNFETLY